MSNNQKEFYEQYYGSQNIVNFARVKYENISKIEKDIIKKNLVELGIIDRNCNVNKQNSLYKLDFNNSIFRRNIHLLTDRGVRKNIKK